MHRIQKPSTQLPMTTWPNTHLCCEWSSYGTHTTSPCPFLAFMVLLFGCGFGKFSWAAPPWLGPLLCSLGVPFPSLLIHRTKVSLLLFELLLNLGSIPVCRTKRGDVEELHFLLNVFVQINAVL
jgi:hypothetical protein